MYYTMEGLRAVLDVSDAKNTLHGGLVREGRPSAWPQHTTAHFESCLACPLRPAAGTVHAEEHAATLAAAALASALRWAL